MRSRRVALVTALALLIALAPSLTAVCVGWEISAKARMACCAKLHGGVTAAKADDCCKGGEQRAHARADAGIVGVVLPEIRIMGVVIPQAPARVPHIAPRNARIRAPEVPPHLLLSVFLL